MAGLTRVQACLRGVSLPVALTLFILLPFVMLSQSRIRMNNLIELLLSFSLNLVEFPALLGPNKSFRGYRSNSWRAFVLDFGVFIILAWTPIWLLAVYTGYNDNYFDGYYEGFMVGIYGYVQCGLTLVLAGVHLINAILDLFQLKNEGDYDDKTPAVRVVEPFP